MEYIYIKNQIRAQLPSGEDFEDNENLLNLGLDSLKVMRLVNLLRKEGIRIPYGLLMEKPTLEQWWKLICSKSKKVTNVPKIIKKQGAKSYEPFPLTDVQYAYKVGRNEGEELGGVDCHAYLEFSGHDVDVDRLNKAWKKVQYHHPMLRARFLKDGTQEIMDKPYEEYITVIDLREDIEVEKKLEDIREELSHRKLDVDNGQVASLRLCLLPNNETRIIFELALLVADVQSMQIILRDLASAYVLKELPKKSKDWSFKVYLENIQKSEEMERDEAKEYWSKRVKDMPFGPELPLEKDPRSISSPRFKRRIVRILKDEWQILKEKSAENKSTPAMLLLSAYALILERWSSNKKFLINIPFFNRKTEYEGLEEVVADFTTLLLLEVDINSKKSFVEVLNSVQGQIHEDMKYTAYSGVQVQRDITKIYGEKQNIAPVVFACNLGNTLVNEEFTNNLGQFSYMISQTPGIWLDFQTYEDEEGVMLTWDSVEELFPVGMLDDMINSFEELLHNLSKKSWNEYFDVLPKSQKEFIEAQKYIDHIEYPKCLHTKFIEKANEAPDKIAIIDSKEGKTISYGELLNMAVLLSSFLIENDIHKRPIAISTTRGYKQAVAALGILMSGNLYVPVTLNQPKERRKLIHEKTGIYYTITDESNYNLTTWPKDVKVWTIEEILSKKIITKLPKVSPESPAYIIMTSGTTGLPKGVEITHKGAWNTINEVNKIINFKSEDKILGISAMDFDLSVYELFGSLAVGATLITIPDEKSKDTEFWLDLILKYKVNKWNSVPALLDMLLIYTELKNEKLPLDTVMLSGNWIGMDLPKRLDKVSKKCKFIAMGGATEASIWSNYIEVKLPLPSNWKSIPYGRPLPHQSYRVVDDNGLDVPFYVEGELLIGGDGVGTYRGDDKLVSEKFINEYDNRWYKTGDKGRFLSDGTIEFLGRKDFQVKIHGHRIELGEIESALKSIDNVKNAVVEANKGKIGDNHLIAYLETEECVKEPLYYLKNEVKEKIESKKLLLGESVEFKDDKHLYNEIIKYAEKRACKIMLNTLQSLDILIPGKRYTYSEITESSKVIDKQKETVKCWLEDLISHDFVEKEGVFFAAKKNYEIIYKGNKEDIEALDTYLKTLEEYLIEVIKGSKNPVDVYYDEKNKLSPNDLLAALPGKDESLNTLILQIKKIVQDSKEKVRILEFGTRDIETTGKILKAVKDLNIEYVYADSSAYFINKVNELNHIYPFFKTKIMSLKKGDERALEEMKYDCVLAINAIHKMSAIDESLIEIEKLLNSSGCLLMLELTDKNCLQHIAATVLENDKTKESRSLILSNSEWIKKLKQNNFEYVCSYPSEDSSIGGRNIYASISKKGLYELDIKYIRKEIEEKLPEYMIPKVYYSLHKIPISKNGKIDRKSISIYSASKIEEHKVEEAVTETEKKLSRIWKEIFEVDTIGALDNYYLLGGDSLIAIRMFARVREVFRVEFSIMDIMENKTLREQAACIDKLIEKGKVIESSYYVEINGDKNKENEPFPLTDVQQAYWIGRKGLYDLGQVSTHCYFELDSEYTDVKKLQKTLNDMIKYHGMMRAIILPSGEQQILKDVPEYKIITTDLRLLSDEEKDKELKNIRLKMSHEVIDTEKWPLFGVKGTVLSDEKIRLHVSFDNLIFDGWSMFHLLSEWLKRYSDENCSFEDLDFSFRDYVLGLNKIKKLGSYEKDKKYWMDRLDNFSSAPDIKLAKKEMDIKNQKFNRRSDYLSENEWSNLKLIAKEYEITPASMLIAAYSEVLRRWSLNSDFALNITQFNREGLHPQVNQLVGDFTTLTLLEIKNSKEDTFLKRVKNLQSQLIRDLEHTHYSAVEFERELKQKKRDIKGSIMPIVFTSGLGINNSGSDKWIGEPVYNVSQTPQVWLDHQVLEQDGGLSLFWDSVDELFYKGMLDEMFDSYTKLLKRLAYDKSLFNIKSTSLVEVPISIEREEANKTEKQLEDKTLDNLFLEMERIYPNKVAVINKDKKITYRELKEKALYICKELKDIKTNKNELVAVLMKKGWKQIVSVYGILFAGAAYLPLDTDNPKERLEKILENSNAKTVLVSKEYLKNNKWLEKWKCIEVTGENLEKDISIIEDKDSSSLAYTIYTSGTTGTPKGVMISHKAAVNTILDVNDRFKVSKGDSALGISKLHFDLSVYDIFGILGVGGTLIIPDNNKMKEPSHWIDLMNENNITIFNSVPASMEMVVEYEEYEKRLDRKDLRLVLMSGDWIPMFLPEKIRNIFTGVKLISLGGATEAGIWSNSFEIPREIPKEWKSIPYGKPLSNQKYYVLDENLNNSPDWVPGGLYIEGKSLASGYMNDEEKTNEKFIIHPVTNERLYFTGDMGRYWSDGNIEFLGRMDFQTKINGYRIELGEIEAAFNSYPNILESYVLCVQGNKGKVLVGFYRSNLNLGEEDIKEHLRLLLPEYMIPNYIMSLDECPKTDNGKVDNKKLIKIAEETIKSINLNERKELVSDEEKSIGEVWKEVLGYENPGAEDNFFSNGGDSLKALHFVNGINEKFNVRISMQDIFENSTISKLVKLIFSENMKTADSNEEIEEGFF
ncbi:yersiniabactin nonribosomal peptide synthetase [Clostridium sp. DSM 8431]|uniref:non-ribosomal peptide synthetase n=1 Tax=Clostridium sp. DSM 8431 TaxID=1761781 RepID=UPI0008E26A5C|nr:non-ribosomal peptide synthetase [Clostridium sp. DSM 8431]SFU41363.1 yersiniabactin nonribosomal peptide synthetase [Clostridium sp. DSM 8431]